MSDEVPIPRPSYRIFLRKARHYLFLILLIFFCFSYFTKDSYKSVDQILPQSLPAPTQTQIVDPKPISFTRDGYAYTLTPLYDYTLDGLILHTQKYDTWYSLSRTDKTFVKDVCMMWGETLARKSYMDKTLSVKQDFRFCLLNYWTPNLFFRANEFSNNHLIASDPMVEWQIRSLQGGDQVRIHGKLVNVKGVATGKTDTYESSQIEWHTSTNRDDTGGGACEVIYVERIEILRQGNPLSRLVFSVSFYGLGILILWTVAAFFIELKKFE